MFWLLTPLMSTSPLPPAPMAATFSRSLAPNARLGTIIGNASAAPAAAAEDLMNRRRDTATTARRRDARRVMARFSGDGQPRAATRRWSQRGGDVNAP